MRASIFVFLFTLGVVFGGVLQNSLSDEFINKINSLGTTWTAGRNFDANTPRSHIKALLGVKPRLGKVLPVKREKLGAENLPESFDSREKWPACASLKVVRDQSTCGSCWAFGAVEAISDRICIHSGGKFQVSISANDLLSCCGFDCGNGCQGGFPDAAWKYWVENGIASGGLYGSNDGCQSYVFAPCEHHTTGSLSPCGESQPTPECTRKCDNSTLNYNDELHFGESAYFVDSHEDSIKAEIYNNGPVEASFDVYEDFMHYKSGVYQHVIGGYEGGHAVKIIGWGLEDDIPYWLVANSWNEDWGEKGYFKMLRGSDECSFEDSIVAGIPKL
ncbi:hypothetical protein WA026_020568 [Henosepilachna vigintioctopunctata]|uniref:Peptidase C1A papain C-terminal domain-containing protein n=1 Tax=Henosepilachna vigintioctopunctata TaxID=420089 RepID=A0AAW1V4L5_9CUCU